ncbi:MAG: 50S ribosomal protein L11 methyltransferase [Clostridia bacterium]|nr:50S ribosomal protein L11 methyltransferase [Clostridia bacterium]
MDWTEVIITIDANDIERAESIAQMVVPYGIYIEDYRTLEQEAWEIANIDLIDEELLSKDRTKGLIHIYISPEESPAEAVAFLSERLNSENISHTVDTSKCKNEDWENNWKDYFKPIKIGEKLLIQPDWLETENDDGRAVLRIEPGLAFGSGTHETTRLCLETLEKYISDGVEVLDLGCGSGILSVASLLLGAKRAVGVDIDKLAVKTANENAQRNGIDPSKYTFINGNLTDKVSGKFDVIVANIVADVIILFTKQVASYLEDGGVFITSGIVDVREDDVLRSFEENGFEVVERHELHNWLCFEVRKK